MIWSTAIFVSFIVKTLYSKYQTYKQLLDSSKRTSQKLSNYIKQSQSELESIIQFPFNDLFKRGGKRLRIILTHSIAGICSKNKQELQQKQDLVDGVAILIQCLHNASLIIDDIQDNSQVRRDQPAVHLKFGIKNSIVSANYIYFKVFNQILKTISNEDKLQISKIFMQQMLVCHLGQADDIFSPYSIRKNQFQVTQFTEKDYIRMVVSKTGALLRMMVRMISRLFKVDENTCKTLVQIVQSTGIAFQIFDDYLNIKGNLNKGGIFQDIVQQKLTLMVIKSLQHPGTSEQFKVLFFTKPKSPQNIKRIITIMEQNKSFQYTLNIIKSYGNTVLSLANTLTESESRNHLILILKKIIYR